MEKPKRSFKQALEDLAFTGLKPDQPQAPRKSIVRSIRHWLESLAMRGLQPDQPLGPKRSIFRRLRHWVESLAERGLQPDEPQGAKPPALRRFTRLLESLAARGLKTEEQEMPGPMSRRKKIGIVVALLAAGGGLFALVQVLQSPAERQAGETARPAPLAIVTKNLKIDKNKDLEVVEIEFVRKEPREIIGTLRNRTDKQFANCEVSFDVTTATGSQLGGVSTVLHNLEPRGTAKFRISVPQKDASFVMVRELRAE